MEFGGVSITIACTESSGKTAEGFSILRGVFDCLVVKDVVGTSFSRLNVRRYYVNSSRNVDSEKYGSQMGFKPTTLRDLVGCSTTELLGTLW